MAYKNSDTTSSIANEFGTWRYFNSGLAKLGEYKAAPISKSNWKAPVEEQVNWLNAIAQAKGAFEDVGEARKEASEKEVDKWLETHSMEDYRNLVATHGVPFQDDPLAMNHLKYRMGETYSKIVYQDFQEQVVDQNKLAGMTPEQRDAEFYKFSHESLTKYLPYMGFDQSDNYFQKGFYHNSLADRVKMISRSAVVEDDWNRNAFIINSSAKLSGMLQAGASPETVYDVIQNEIYNGGYHLKPQELQSIMEKFIAECPTTSNGLKILEGLKDKEVPRTGVTFGAMVDPIKYQAYQVRAQNYKDQADFQSYTRLMDIARGWAANGNTDLLIAGRDSVLATNGNLETDQVKELDKLIEQSRRVNAKLLADEQRAAVKQQAEQDKQVRATDWLYRASHGGKMERSEVSDITKTDLNKVYQGLLNSKDANGNPLMGFNDQYAMAVNPTVAFDDNPARQRFKEQATVGLDLIEGYVDQALNNNLEGIPTGNKDMPEEINKLFSIYKANPARFSEATDLSTSKANEVSAMYNLIEGGRPFRDIIRAKAGIKMLGETKEGRKKLEDIKNGAIEVVLDSIGSKKTDIDYYGRGILTNLTGNFIAMGVKDPQQALEKAEAELAKSYVSFLGATVPRSFFGDFGGDDIELLDTWLSKFLKDNNLTDAVIPSYNPQTKTLAFFNQQDDMIDRYSSVSMQNLMDTLREGKLEQLNSPSFRGWLNKITEGRLNSSWLQGSSGETRVPPSQADTVRGRLNNSWLKESSGQSEAPSFKKGSDAVFRDTLEPKIPYTEKAYKVMRQALNKSWLKQEGLTPSSHEGLSGLIKDKLNSSWLKEGSPEFPMEDLYDTIRDKLNESWLKDSSGNPKPITSKKELSDIIRGKLNESWLLQSSSFEFPLTQEELFRIIRDKLNKSWMEQ